MSLCYLLTTFLRFKCFLRPVLACTFLPVDATGKLVLLISFTDFRGDGSGVHARKTAFFFLLNVRVNNFDCVTSIEILIRLIIPGWILIQLVDK